MAFRKMTKSEKKKREKEQRLRREEQKKKFSKFRKDDRCRFCRNKIATVDYKDVAVIVKLCTNQGKLYSRKRSGNCAFHQRSSQLAVKRARYMALVSYLSQ